MRLRFDTFVLFALVKHCAIKLRPNEIGTKNARDYLKFKRQIFHEKHGKL